MVFELLPDVDAYLVAFLKTHPQLTGLHGGRVGTKLPAGTDPAVRTSSLGGVQTWPWRGDQDFQIEWWGGDQGQAKLLARTGEAVVYDLVGHITGGWIRAVEVVISQLWTPDEATGRARYITQIRITVYPEGS